MPHLGENRYGKSRVRVMKVVRHATHHALCEWQVRVLLHGDFDRAFTHADNSPVLPTDTMKNTVYWLARESSATTPEAFATELADYLLANNPHVSQVSVEIEEKNWQQLPIDGVPHPTTYTLGGPQTQTVAVLTARGAAPIVAAGIDGLVILKTTHSEFTGFLRDKLTTLKESTDRIFGTRATIAWEYSAQPADYRATRAGITETLLQVFAAHHSLSVQHTLYDMGAAVIAATPEVARIKLTMPNLHCLLVDLKPFGQDNPNQVFVPIDEPHGYIEAVIER